ncbi:MAG: prenyltransferase [Caldilineaceae bacterium]
MPPHSVGNLAEQSSRSSVINAGNKPMAAQLDGHAPHTSVYNIPLSPRTFAGALALVTRIDLLLVLLFPTFGGVMLAWWEMGHIDVPNTLFTLFTIAACLQAIHLLAEYKDYKFSVAPEGKYVDERPFAGSSLLIRKLFLPHTVLGFSIILFMLSTASLAWLVLLAGWPVLFFLGLTGLFYFLRMAPPSMHGYLAWGLGELGCFIGIGLLQLLNGYYVQSGVLSALPFYVGAPAGLLAILTPFTHDLIYRRRDWISRKRTLAVTLGDRRSLNFSALVILAIYASFFVLVIVAAMPLTILICLAALPIMVGGMKQMYDEQPAPAQRLLLYRATIKGSAFTWLLFLLALWIDKAV